MGARGWHTAVDRQIQKVPESGAQTYAITTRVTESVAWARAMLYQPRLYGGF